jgi:hypothetical protein
MEQLVKSTKDFDIFGAESYRDTFRSENRFLSRKSAVIVARSSRLHEIFGLG